VVDEIVMPDKQRQVVVEIARGELRIVDGKVETKRLV
jgi:hypothetical protein